MFESQQLIVGSEVAEVPKPRKSIWEDHWDQLIKRSFAPIIEQREEILKAFIAKHGCGPEDLYQVTEVRDGRIVWSLGLKARPEYRTFTDRDGYSSVAVKKVGDAVTVLARADTYNDAFHAILEDAGLKIDGATRDEGKNYNPKPGDFR